MVGEDDADRWVRLGSEGDGGRGAGLARAAARFWPSGAAELGWFLLFLF
jgi:hypothetical protein